MQKLRGDPMFTSTISSTLIYKRGKGPSLIDTHVGKRLRACRIYLGLSQAALSQKMGISFQQLQKYERGDNRISAGRLYLLSKIFEVPVDFFFKGVEERESQHSGVYDLIDSCESIEVLRTYQTLKDPTIRRRIRDLIRDLGGGEQGDRSSAW